MGPYKDLVFNAGSSLISSIANYQLLNSERSGTTAKLPLG